MYRFSKIAGEANRFSVAASKVVDGKEIVMGSSEWKYDQKKEVVECEKPSIQLKIDGDKMEGALRLEDSTVYRRIYLKKAEGRFASDVLEFLCNEKARDLRAGAVLSDEVHLLQFSYGSGGEGTVCAVCGGGV